MRSTAVVVGVAVVLSLALVGPGLAGPTATVASGSFGAVEWTLSAADSSDGYVCLTITLPRHPGGGSTSCGSIFGPAAGQAHGITYLAHTGVPAPNYIVGPVAAIAKTVVITLSNGKTLRTKTIAPPKRLTSRIAFYAAELPWLVQPTSVRGISAAGRTVACLAIRRLPPLGKATC